MKNSFRPPAVTQSDETAPEAAAQALAAEFWDRLGRQFPLTPFHEAQIVALIGSVGIEGVLPAGARRAAFQYCAAKKLKVNERRVKAFIDECAAERVFFNYHEKADISEAFDRSDELIILPLLDKKAARHLLSRFAPASEAEIQEALAAELQSTLNRRTKQREEHRVTDLVHSLLGAFVYSCLDERAIHHVNDPMPDADYEARYWNRLTRHQGHLFARDEALAVRIITPSEERSSFEDLNGQLKYWIAQQFDRLNNHGFLALVIEPGVQGAWRLAEDAMLIAERLCVDRTPPAFHRGQEVWKELLEDLAPALSLEPVAEALYEGFLYRDCFVSACEDGTRLVLIFQKNVRDQTPVPCPTCRSHDVRSNSYPSLGVRSWECSNWICPDRSRSNRGKRFAFWSLLCQQGLLDD